MAWSFETEEDIRRVVRSVLATEGMNLSTKTPVRNRPAAARATWLGVTTEEISAADWDADPPTVGSGDVRLYRLKTNDADPRELEPVSTSEAKTCFNVIPAPIAKNKIVQVKVITGLPIIDVESCVSVDIIT